MRRRETIVRVIIVLALLAGTGFGMAQEQGTSGGTDWTDIGVLSGILTDGNSEAWSVGLRNTLEGKGSKSHFELLTSAYRLESTSRVLFALGPTQTDF